MSAQLVICQKEARIAGGRREFGNLATYEQARL